MSRTCVYVRYDLGKISEKDGRGLNDLNLRVYPHYGGDGRKPPTGEVRISSVMSCKGSRVHGGESKYYMSRPEKDLLFKVQLEDAALLLPVPV